MNVLHFTNKPIFPTYDGGRLAKLHLLMNLFDLGYQVKNLTIETHKHPFIPESFPKEILEKIETEAVFVNTKISFLGYIRAFLKGQSYNVLRFKSKKVEEKIKEILKDNVFDVIILESSFLMIYLPVLRQFSDAKIIVRSHNVEYRIWRQTSKKEKFFIKKYIYSKLTEQLKKFELTHLNQVDGVFCISEQDKDFFRRRSIRTRMEVIPVYMEVKNQYEVDYESNEFCFIGSMNWKPNMDAVNWIVNAIVPKYRKINPDFKFHIAGSNMPKHLKNLKNKNVVIHGRVPDNFEFMSKHGTLIVPIKTGSGIRIKILEAMSVGVPIITTDKGKEGINLTPKKEYLAANMTEEIVLQMKNCQNNTELKRSLGENSKEFIAKFYSKEIVSKKISDFIKKI